MAKLLLATNNKGKVREYQHLLQGIPFEVVTLAQEGINDAIEESGKSLEENAVLKAEYYASRSGLLTLADDSGLEVDTLNGEPGARSARYAGENATDEQRVDYLLGKLRGVPWEKRTARFRCVIALADPENKTRLYSGECHGYITLESRGEYGFGYDPVFYFPELGKTMAELPLDIKNKVSHRSRAARKARLALKRLGNRYAVKESA